MLVHPEIYAFLNRQNNTETVKKKDGPRVSRGEKINKGGTGKAHQTQLYESEMDDEAPKEVEYLNERKSSLNFYA